MKSLIMHKGKLTLFEIADAPCNPHSIKVKTLYSAVSFGTESNSSKSQSLMKMTLDAEKWAKAYKLLKSSLNPTAVVRKYANLSKIYQSVGYSLVGEVLEIGSNVTQHPGLKVGDLVHCGGELAFHASVVVVPQNFVFKLDAPAEKLPLLSAATIASVSVHGVERALDFCPPSLRATAVVTGGGVIGFWAALYLKLKGFKKILIVDPSEKTMTDIAFPRHKNESANAVLVCAPSMSGVDNLVAEGQDGISICIVGETQLQLNRQIIEDKYGVLSFCKSFGYGRGNKAYEMGIDSVNENLFPHTIRKNIESSLRMIQSLDKSEHQDLLNITPFNKVSLDGTKINVIDWKNA